jgi:3-hydroxy-9,10-secoandrosta-1,3,5(10)-triene-9,17-dione monooxygenase reductase component
VSTADGPPHIDLRRLRNVLGQFCTGVTVIATLDARGEPVGFACQSFAALSLEPPLVLFCPTRGSRVRLAVERAGKFCVNILSEQQGHVCARFGSREPDKFAGIGWRLSDLDLPLLNDSLAAIQCAVANVVDGGDHVIVIGRVLTLDESTDSGRPLLFYRGQYAAIESDTRVPASWRADLEHFLTTTTLDMWL